MEKRLCLCWLLVYFGSWAGFNLECVIHKLFIHHVPFYFLLICIKCTCIHLICHFWYIHIVHYWNTTRHWILDQLIRQIWFVFSHSWKMSMIRLCWRTQTTKPIVGRFDTSILNKVFLGLWWIQDLDLNGLISNIIWSLPVILFYNLFDIVRETCSFTWSRYWIFINKSFTMKIRLHYDVVTINIQWIILIFIFRYLNRC